MQMLSFLHNDEEYKAHFQMLQFLNLNKRCLSFGMKTWLLYEFEHGYNIDSDFWSTGMIPSLATRCLEFISRNASLLKTSTNGV